MRAFDDLPDSRKHRCVALIEQFRTDLGVTIDTEHELREVVRTDGHTIDAHGGILTDPVDDRRNLGHHPPSEIALRTERTAIDEFETFLELPRRADERQHHMQVGRTFPNPGQRLEFEIEYFRLLSVPEAAPIPDHRILLNRLEARTALQGTELIRSEVRRSIDHRSGEERRGDSQQRLGHVADELFLATGSEEGLGMRTAQRLGQQELRPQEPDAVDPVHRSCRLRPIGERQVHIELRGERLHRNCGAGRPDDDVALRLIITSEFGHHVSEMDHTSGAIHSDDLTVTQHGGRRTASNNRWHADLPAHDRRMTGEASPVGDDRRRSTDRGHPIRTGHRCDKDLAVTQQMTVFRGGQDPNPTGDHTGRCAETDEEWRDRWSPVH